MMLNKYDISNKNLILGKNIYHTNVVLSICTKIVLVCEKAVRENENLRTLLSSTKR